MTTKISALERGVLKTREWIDETAAELGADDPLAAYRALRAVLHAIRDRITVEESAQLAAQLPGALRGAFYEDWVPSRVPATYHDVDSFLARIGEEALIGTETQASYAAVAVMAVMRRHVSPGELDDVLAVLPGPVRALLTSVPEG